MDHDPLPTDVRRKLEQAYRWLRARDAWLAECLEAIEVRAGRRVILARPDGPIGLRHRILVNPNAVRALPADVVAGALVSSLLASPPEACGGTEAHAELWLRAERVRRGLQLT